MEDFDPGQHGLLFQLKKLKSEKNEEKFIVCYDSQVGSHPQYIMAEFHLSPERQESCLELSFITKKSSSQDHRGLIYVIESMAFL